jgi:hypothetical protein
MSACAGCVAPSCPADVPVSGEACNQCSSPIGQPCEYADCPASKVLAVCDGERWSVHASTCDIPGCCATDTECGAGLMCVSTVCKAPAAEGCWRDTDCADGSMCSGAFVCPCNADCDSIDYPGTCIAADASCCRDDASCGNGRCVSGMCKPPLGGGTCWSDRDCFGGTCYGARVCPCGTQCILADEPGYCL